MNINFCDLQRQHSFLKENIDKRINEVLNHCKFINGPEVEELEKKCANYVGTKYAIGVASGTDALLLSLIALDIKKGDYIITTPFTFIASAEVINLVGATPLFVDISSETYNIDAKKLEEFLKNPVDPKTRKRIFSGSIKGIIAVNLFGQPAEYDKIEEIANRNKLFILEDAAQSFGAVYQGRKSCSLGDISATSFFPTKPLGCYGDGGMIFTNNERLFKKIRLIRNHGQEKKYEHDIIGTNSRLDSIQAAVLLAKLEKFEDELKKRKEVVKEYFYGLNILNNKKIKLPKENPDCESVYAQFSILTENRDKLAEFLNNNSIPSAIHYPKPLHLQKAFENLGYKEGDFKISEEISKKIISLPFDAYKQKEEIKYICDKILEFYK